MTWGAFSRHPGGAAEGDTQNALDAELARARAKFPGNRFLLAAATEELGELAQALLHIATAVIYLRVGMSPAAARAQVIAALNEAVRQAAAIRAGAVAS